MKNMNRNVKVLLILIAIGLIATITAFSYAWFVGRVSGNPTNPNVVTSGKMEVTYSDGQVVGTTTSMIPGQQITKSFSVTNTGNTVGYYDIYLNNIVNTFVDKNDLVYTLSSSTGGASIIQTVCPSADTKIASNVSIAVGATHTYTLTIKFLETYNDQSDNVGASFSTRVSLLENQSSGGGSSGSNDTPIAAQYTPGDPVSFPVTLYGNPSGMLSSLEIDGVGDQLLTMTNTSKYYLYQIDFTEYEKYEGYIFDTLQECKDYIDMYNMGDGSIKSYCDTRDIRAVTGSFYMIPAGLSNYMKATVDSTGTITAFDMCYNDAETGDNEVCFNISDNNIISKANSYFGCVNQEGAASSSGMTEGSPVNANSSCHKYTEINDMHPTPYTEVHYYWSAPAAYQSTVSFSYDYRSSTMSRIYIGGNENGCYWYSPAYAYDINQSHLISCH